MPPARFPRRCFVALALFCHFTMNNGFSWIMFDPVAENLQETFHGLTLRQVELLSSWQPIVYIFACLPLTVLQNTNDGLRSAVHLGAISELAGSMLKVFGSILPGPAARNALLHIGQIFSAVASPVAIGAPVMLSALWFTESSRTKATAAAVICNDVGLAIGYVLIPLLTSSFGFRSVLLLEVISASILVLNVFLWFPHDPRRAPDLEQQEANTQLIQPPADQSQKECAPVKCYEKMGQSVTLRQARDMLKLHSCVVLCLVYAWVAGGYVAWTSLFDVLLGGDGRFSPVFIGFVSFAGMVAYSVGGIVTSILVDMCWRHSMGTVLLWCAIINTVACALFVTTLGVQNNSGPEAPTVVKALVITFSFVAGWFNGSAAPVFYEFVAYLSAPVPEAVSGNVLSLGENIGALLIYQCLARTVPRRYVSLSYAIGMGVCVAALWFSLRGRFTASRSAELHSSVEPDTEMRPHQTERGEDGANEQIEG